MKCSHQKSDDNKCQANAMNGSIFCFAHDPTMKQKHLEATKKGGEATHNRDYVQLDAIPVEDASSTLYLITDTINRIRTTRTDGTMDLKTANAVGFLAGKLLECKKQLLLEEDLLKKAIFKDQKIDTDTFRQLMWDYEEEHFKKIRSFAEGAEQRYEEYKKTKSNAYMF